MTTTTSNNTQHPIEQTYYFIIKGNVQKIGFRDVLENDFINLGLDSAIYNYDDGTVRVVVNTDNPEFIKNLILQLSKKIEKELNKPIIKSIEYHLLIEYLNATNGVMPLPSKDMRVDINTLRDIADRLDDGVNHIKKIYNLQEQTINEIKGLREDLNEKFDILNKKFDILIEILKQK
jgi:acylphosphatase